MATERPRRLTWCYPISHHRNPDPFSFIDTHASRPTTMWSSIGIEKLATGHEPAHWLYTFDEEDGKTTVSLKVDYTLPGKWLGQVVDRLLVERKNRQQVEAAVAVPA